MTAPSVSATPMFRCGAPPPFARTTSSLPDDDATEEKRKRILNAAFAIFSKRGYCETTTLEIAQRARVSKRELYALVGNKEEMLLACIRKRAPRLEMPANSTALPDRASLARKLEQGGATLLREVSVDAVLRIYPAPTR